MDRSEIEYQKVEELFQLIEGATGVRGVWREWQLHEMEKLALRVGVDFEDYKKKFGEIDWGRNEKT